jgi:hypothetical protein
VWLGYQRISLYNKPSTIFDLGLREGRNGKPTIVNTTADMGNQACTLTALLAATKSRLCRLVSIQNKDGAKESVFAVGNPLRDCLIWKRSKFSLDAFDGQVVPSASVSLIHRIFSCVTQ